jgi:hypothetical protein
MNGSDLMTFIGLILGFATGLGVFMHIYMQSVRAQCFGQTLAGVPAALVTGLAVYLAWHIILCLALAVGFFYGLYWLGSKIYFKGK